MRALAAVQTTSSPSSTMGSNFFLQRKCACGGPAGLSGTCEECANKQLLGQPLQAKLVVGAPDDPLEQEADRVAEQVMRMPGGEPEHRPTGPGPVPLVQRRVAGSTAGTFAAPPLVHQVLSSPGRPLGTATRAFFEPRFGHDFSRVRIHTDSTAADSAQSIQAQAYTVGEHIVVDARRYFPGMQADNRLLAHELTHVLQQSAEDIPVVQRDLAIEPQVATPVERTLTERDIEDAVRFNSSQFDDPYTFAVIRDVIGVSRFPAVSDRVLALGVASWQAQHGVAQDGRLGSVTVTFIVEELQAEGNDADAALLIADFPNRSLLDITTAFCGCIPRLERQVQESDFFIGEYSACGADPANTTGAQIESCISSRAANGGVTLVTAGTTSSSGAVRVAPVAGPCGPLEERLTLAHEQIHSVHTRELQQIHGRGSRSFLRAFNDAGDWVDDEINSRRTDIAVANWMIDVLGRACS